ncbi:Bug family tripartite tricarboxylate transporter substrate binding protein [Candidimonas nitroreducens]|nr:tripartite tricarboxylate transporter substrate binding protein [Candidimonas nitroreducens]
MNGIKRWWWLTAASTGMLAGAIALFASPCQASNSDAANAKSFPSHPVHLIVGFAAGGATDLQARMLAEGLTKLWGESVIVENVGGASGSVAAGRVAKDPADGYTLLVDTAGALTIRPQLEKVPYDTLNDFIPITAIATNDAVIVVASDFPANNFQEFLKVTKANPGKYTYGTSGMGSITMLGMEAFKRRAGFDIRHIPYKGDSQVLLDVMGDHIPIGFVAIPSVASQLSSGKVRALATLGQKRLKLFPKLPTVGEFGYTDQICSSWIGILAPAHTPDAIVQKLNHDIRQVANDPKFIAKLEQGGSRAFNSSVAEFTQFVKQDMKAKGDIIKAINLKLE